MRRVKYILGYGVGVIGLMVIVNNFVFNFFFPLGCDYKDIHILDEDRGYAYELKTPYSYSQLRNFLINNRKYEIRDNENQIYITRKINNAEIVLKIYQYEMDSYMVMKKDKEKVKYNFYIYNGVNCHTPDWRVRNIISQFISDLSLPKDLDRVLNNYIVVPASTWNIGI